MSFVAMRHQARAIPEMVRGHYMLIWDPGTGKTYPCLVASLFKPPTLCIVPAHLREQWAEQAREHVPTQRVTILDKTKEKINAAVFANSDIVIVSYEYVATLPRWKELRRARWGAIVLDEFHYLIHADANRTRAILGTKLGETHGLVFAADVVWLLSGTPFTFPNEIYPTVSRLFPEAIRRPESDGPGLMTAREWENRFCQVKETDFGAKIVGAKNIPELRARLAPYLNKVKIEDVADLKPLTVDEIPIKGSLKELTRNLSGEVLAQYEILTELLLDDDVLDSEKLAAIGESELVMAQLRHHIAVVKIKPMAEIIRAELKSGVDKLLILGWHKEPLKALAAEFNAPIIHGDITAKGKAAAKDEFINDRGCHVLFGQISSIATGTDGLQEVCHREIFMEMSWRYLENKQGIHRIYRKGQQFPCHVSVAKLLGSVDEYVARVLRKNAEIVARALD